MKAFFVAIISLHTVSFPFGIWEELDSGGDYTWSVAVSSFMKISVHISRPHCPFHRCWRNLGHCQYP